MKKHVSKALICLKANIGIEYAVCKIEYRLNEDETFCYLFSPDYSVISLLTSKDFQGIPGLNLDLKRETYKRENMVPVFISERVPQKNREDLYEILEHYGMEYMEPLEFLIRAKDAYFGDNFYLIPYKKKEKAILSEQISKCNTWEMLQKALSYIAKGDEVKIGDIEVDDSNRKMVHDLLLPFYLKGAKRFRESLETSVKIGPEKKRGRPRAKVEFIEFMNTKEEVERGNLTETEAAKKLGVSTSTYKRLKKKKWL